MLKKLIKHDNDLALLIDKPTLELLHITAETLLEVTTTEHAILIRPIRDDHRQQQLRTSLEKINRTFGEDLERLSQ